MGKKLTHPHPDSTHPTPGELGLPDGASQLRETPDLHAIRHSNRLDVLFTVMILFEPHPIARRNGKAMALARSPVKIFSLAALC